MLLSSAAKYWKLTDFREEVVEGSKQEANQIPGIVRRIGGEQNVCFPSIPDYWPPLEIGN